MQASISLREVDKGVQIVRRESIAAENASLRQKL